MSESDILLTLAAGLVVAAILAIFVAGTLSPKPKKRDHEQHAKDLAASQKLLYDAMRKDRTHMLDSPRYKPAVSYVSPERKEPVPANVTKLRRKS